MELSKYTTEQQKAITTHNCDLLVAAAAGSGKTAVLVERIICMITDEKNPIDIDNILIVTFTEAAASEMRQRISDAIILKLNSDPLNEHLQKQISLLNKSYITTIHSFCLNVVRKNFNIIDIDPNFRIADQTEIELLKSETLEEIFEELYSHDDNIPFFNLVESYSKNTNDNSILELILDIYKFIQSSPRPIKWLNENIEKFNIASNKSIYDTEWGNIIKNEILVTLDSSKDAVNRCLEIIEEEDKENTKYKNALFEDLDLINSIYFLLQSGIERVYNIFSEKISFTALRSSKKDKLSKEAKEKIRTIRTKEIKEPILELQSKIFFASPEEIKNCIKSLYPIMKTLGEIITLFDERFKSTKKEKLILDFNDLEHFCLQILVDENDNPTKYAEEFKEKFEEIMIDEYQDSNLIQELILSSVSRKSLGKPNRFMVGDIKQCIYKFRLANPELFMQKYNSYSTTNNSDTLRIDLFKNFRSKKNILASINFIFYQLMTSSVGEIKYDKSSALYYGASFKDTINNYDSVELHIIDTKQGDDEIKNENLVYNNDIADEINELTTAELEATFVAKRINEIISDESFVVYDKSVDTYRRVEYKDIVILLRSTKKTADVFYEILSSNGIPAFTNNSSGYFEYVEVMTIMSLLQLIDNIHQDLHLITVLYSPIYSLTSDELTEIRTVKKEISFYNCIEYYISDENKNNADNNIVNKLEKFFKDIYNWKKLALYTPIDELLWIIYEETNYYNYVGILSGGAIRQANLRALQEKAIQFENTSLTGLFQFIKYIERIKRNSGDFGDAKILSENENLVRIMSIHKSKGLEFPVVFVSMLGKKFNMKDISRDMLFHQNLGFGPVYVDFENRIKYNTVAKYAISQKIKQESLSEELRILYVALTRAKEKLILTGSALNIEKKLDNWLRFINLKDKEIPDYYMLKASSFLDWIIPAISRHRNAEKLLSFKNIISYNHNNELYNDISNWDINIIYRNDLVINKRENIEKNSELYTNLKNHNSDNDYSNNKSEIFKRLSWYYPNILEQNLPSKVSISEIKRNFYMNQIDTNSEVKQEITFKTPNFIKEQTSLTSAERGTATHTVLEHINFNTVKTYDDLKNFLKYLNSKNILTKQETEEIDINKISNFLNSSIADRIRNSNNVKREIPFVMGLTPYDIYNDINYKFSNSIILVHGIIDLYFEENGKIILLDYKTDYVPKGGVEKIKHKYKTQIELYKKAIERNTSKEVSESILYLFGINDIVYL